MSLASLTVYQRSETSRLDSIVEPSMTDRSLRLSGDPSHSSVFSNSPADARPAGDLPASILPLPGGARHRSLPNVSNVARDLSGATLLIDHSCDWVKRCISKRRSEQHSQNPIDQFKSEVEHHSRPCEHR